MKFILPVYLGVLLAPIFIEARPSLSSDTPIVYDTEKKCSLAEGNAEFLNNEFCLNADRIYYFAENAKILAQGNVHITNSFLRAKTDKGSYIHTQQTLDAPTFVMEVKGNGVTGRNLHGTVHHMLADDLTIDCNNSQNSTAGVHITAKHGALHGNEYFELYDAVFHIGALPLFYTPYYRHDFKHSTLRWKSDIGLIRRDKKFGRYVRNDLLFDFGWRFKPGLMLDYYRKRDLLVGGILEYDDDWGKGVFKAARSHDADITPHITADPYLKNPRYMLEWKHQGHLSPDTDLSIQMEWMGDKNFFKDFRPEENDGTRQHPDNFAEISHRTKNSVTSLLARYRFNHFQQIQERLPELKFEYLPVRWHETPLYYQYGFGLCHLRENPSHVSRITSKEIRRIDGYFGLSAPQNLCQGCTFTPIAQTRLMQYFNLSNAAHKNDYMRCLWQIGFDLKFKAYSDYTYNNEYWNIHNFRHLIQPIIQYRYMPHGHQGKSFIPAIDREAQDSRTIPLQEIDLLHRRDIDDLNDMHLLRLGLENFLYTNYKKNSPSQWIHLNFYQDILLKKSIDIQNKKQKTLSDTFIDFEWTPSSFFSLNHYLRYDPNQKQLHESKTSISLRENDLWRLSLSHDYIQTGNKCYTNQNSVKLSYRINSTNVVSAAISVDAHKPDLIRQTYTWSTILAKTWALDFIFEWKKRKRPLAANTKDSWNVRFILNFIEW
jgi:lipopolysaccharide assembly outer membrane protein LptD (OstA)